MPVVIDLDIGSGKKVSVSELIAAINVTAVSDSVLENGRVKAVRFAALDDVGRVLACQPGAILRGSLTAWILDGQLLVNRVVRVGLQVANVLAAMAVVCTTILEAGEARKSSVRLVFGWTPRRRATGR